MISLIIKKQILRCLILFKFLFSKNDNRKASYNFLTYIIPAFFSCLSFDLRFWNQTCIENMNQFFVSFIIKKNVKLLKNFQANAMVSIRIRTFKQYLL